MNKNDYNICVVSYKRPNNNTCKLLSNSELNWNVFVYSFDPYINEYLEKYGEHVIQLSFRKPNLARKRQFVLDYALEKKLKYCIMLDDDIYSIKNVWSFSNDKFLYNITIETMIINMLQAADSKRDCVALSTAYNLPTDEFTPIEYYKNICNNSIFNMDIYRRNKYIKYNPDSKCEDMEFTIELLIRGLKTGRLNWLLVNNTLQGGTTNDGLSYRFENKNRFIEEGEYMQNKYPNIKDIFEYDENHFKMNTSKLIHFLVQSNEN